MHVCRLLTAAIVVAPAAGCGSTGPDNLTSAEKAFSREGIHLSSGIQMYVGTDHRGTSGRSLQEVRSLLAHVRQTAAAVGPGLEFRTILVMDNPASASNYAAFARGQPHTFMGNSTVLLAQNIVYVGKDDADARRAMKELAGDG